MENEETVTEKEIVETPVDDDDHVVVTIGEEAPPTEEEEVAKAPEWVRELRKSHKELARENRTLKEQIAAKEQPDVAQIGTKPTLEACEYDAEKYEAQLATWYDKKRTVDDQARRIEEEKQAQERTWQQKLDGYTREKSDLKVKDFDDAEDTVKNVLSVTQQGVIIQGADNPALVVYALGKNPKKAAELAAISDPVKYAFAIAKLETQLKVSNRKAPPPPEKSVGGTGSLAASTDATLDRLRAEAEKSGDYTKVREYRDQKRRKAA